MTAIVAFDHDAWAEANGLEPIAKKRGGPLTPAEMKQRKEAASGRGGGGMVHRAGRVAGRVSTAYAGHSRALFAPVAGSRRAGRMEARARRGEQFRAGMAEGRRKSEQKGGFRMVGRRGVVFNDRKSKLKAAVKYAAVAGAVAGAQNMVVQRAASKGAQMTKGFDHAAWAETHGLGRIA